MPIVKLDSRLYPKLVARGMPRDVIRMPAFNTDQHLISFASEMEGLKTRRVTKKQQQQALLRVLERPFSAPYLMAISSSPNDGKAKQLAAFLLQNAMRAHMSGKFRSTRGRDMPMWHFLTGSFQDKLRDGEDRPSMLILSNLTKDSTNVKFEKCRDILEKYNDIPRIIVMTPDDPLTMVNSRLYMPVNVVLHLATARKLTL